LRIIAGSARGRQFDAPPGSNTRPTLDRVKESMFGSIQFDIPDSTVLDLFSGSGNLGLEAASRGAKRVICNDYDRTCAELIQKNAEKLKLDSIVCVTCKDYVACLSDLKRMGERFDFVFLDPPYQEGAAKVAIEAIFTLGLLTQRAECIWNTRESFRNHRNTACKTETDEAIRVMRRIDLRANE